MGGGPAGLCAAYQISRFAKNRQVIILDGGPSKSNRSGNLPNRGIQCPVSTEGYGGAGVFADKLYFDVAGGWLEQTGAGIDARIYMSLVSEIFEKFTDFKAWGSGEGSGSDFKIKGLSFKPYPNIVSVTLSQYMRFIDKLVENLKSAGVKIRFSTKVKSVTRGADSRFRLQFDDGKIIESDIVLLATGRGSTTWLESQVTRLGVKLGRADSLLGVRIETLTSRVHRLNRLALDPKIRTNDRNTKVHCMCYGGHVISCSCENMTLVDGTRFAPETKNSSFNILTRLSNLNHDHHDGQKIAMAICASPRGLPKVQRMDDFRGGTPSTLERIRSGQVSRTLNASAAGNIAGLLPDPVRQAIIDFIDSLQGYVPLLGERDNLIYAPVLEWFYPKVVLDEKSWMTDAPGLFVTGDSAGLSQGVVMACASGMKAGLAIEEYIGGHPADEIAEA